MGNEDYGECSRGPSKDSDRPLKKAKYVWQVKGKYHLKSNCQNDATGGDCSSSSSSSSPSTPTCSQSPKEPLSDSECEKQNIEGKNPCIERFLARTEAILDRVVQDPSGNKANEISSTFFSPPHYRPRNNDNMLSKWQALQITRGYIDNTINSVLETWVTTPGLDSQDLMEHCDDNHIEDEGILMAIEAHGLSTSATKEQPQLAFVRPDQLADNTLDKIDTVHGSEMESSSNEVEIDEPPLPNETVYPVDILNAAILVAIERKGLSNTNTSNPKK